MPIATSTSTSIATQPSSQEISAWQRWLHHPETSWTHRALFQVHLWFGMIAAVYVTVMSLSGSAIVFRSQLESSARADSLRLHAVEWLVDLHENLLAGDVGRRLNGIGALAVVIIILSGAVIWWPGIEHWRRSLRVNWRSHFARLNWDLHNVLGVWSFLFLVLWGFTGIYFAFPELSYPFVASSLPESRTAHFAGQVLQYVTSLHFGRFGWPAELLWVAIGLVPALLVLTGIFMCCHRLLIRKGAPLPR
jgi:uncharacterized iron-regulated membrane protein